MTNPLHAWLIAHPSVRHWMIAHYVGVHRVTVSLWRVGKRFPTTVHQRQLAGFTAHHGAGRVTLEQWALYRQKRAPRDASSFEGSVRS